MQARFTWDLKPRLKRVLNSKQRFARLRNAIAIAWRFLRVALEILGGIFLYFLILGYAQYMDQQAASQLACAFARCM
ncbi:hypothetical protein BM43_3172 [Burkholderia gladioli]|nr:hypothetical protein BM43_3172 [Burkholderia gladioli]SPV21787.1 Uncharacterised protein [Burkholderia gladioli]